MKPSGLSRFLVLYTEASTIIKKEKKGRILLVIDLESYVDTSKEIIDVFSCTSPSWLGNLFEVPATTTTTKIRNQYKYKSI